MAVFQLDNNLWFPDPHLGEDDGLIAVGGDLGCCWPIPMDSFLGIPTAAKTNRYGSAP